MSSLHCPLARLRSPEPCKHLIIICQHLSYRYTSVTTTTTLLHLPRLRVFLSLCLSWLDMRDGRFILLLLNIAGTLIEICRECTACEGPRLSSYNQGIDETADWTGLSCISAGSQWLYDANKMHFVTWSAAHITSHRYHITSCLTL